jgi:hypothetical protein
MTTNYKSLAFLLVCTVSNSLSAQTAEFDAASGYLTIPLLKLGADVYEQVRFQYDGALDFNVVDYAKKTESDAKTNATFDGSTLDLKVVKVGEEVYSNLEFAFESPLKFSITKVQEPKKISRTSLGNRTFKDWVDFNAVRSGLESEYKEKYNSWASNGDPAVQVDIDLDGDDDLFIATLYYPLDNLHDFERMVPIPSELWINTGNGDYEKKDTIITNGMPRFVHPRKVITADLNGDLFPEIIVGDQGWDGNAYGDGYTPGAPLVVIESSIDGSYNWKTIGGIGFHHGISAGDFDNDGDVDIFSIADVNGGLFLNDGLGEFKPTTILEKYKRNKFYNTVSADVDEDGYDDIVVLSNENAKPTILYQGLDGFTDYQALELPTIEGYGTINDAGFTDLNSDGVKDIVINATGDSSSSYYKGNAFYGVLLTEDREVGQIILIYKDESYSEDWVRFIRVEDINADGIDDIFSFNKSRNFVFLGDGGGNFERKYAAVSPEFRSWDIKADLNDDGYEDAITRQSSRYPDTVTYGSSEVFIDRRGRFLELPAIPDFPFTFKFAVGDLNSDGNSDLVATATNTSTGSNVGCAVGVYFLVGKELNSYKTVYADPESQTCYEPRLSDYDSDGDLDISTWGNVRITLINDGEGGFTLLE